MRRSLPGRWLLALVCGAGCFTDAAPSGGEDGTTGGVCPIATLGCPCDGGQCDEGLACEPSVSRCIDPACMPGTLLCTCIDGLCLEGLQCDGALCQSPEGSTSTTGQVTSTGTSTTASTSTTDDPSASLTDDSDSSVSMTTGPVSDVGPPSCEALPCADCRECVVAPGGACRETFTSCQNIPVCAAVSNCALACDEQSACIAACCSEHGDGMNLQYNGTIANCVEMACVGCSPDLTCPA